VATASSLPCAPDRTCAGRRVHAPLRLDASVRRFLRGLEGDRFKLDVLFGVTTEPAFEDLAREVFDTFRTPLLRIEFRREGQWRLHQVTMQSLQRLAAGDREAFAAALEGYLARRWRAPRSPRR